MARAGEIMTTNIVAARPDMPVRDVAKLLLDHGISAAPVMDAAGNLLGIVSEGDLISRNADRSEKSRGGWRCSPTVSSWRRASSTMCAGTDPGLRTS
jgi:CBS domain-containing protein